MLFISLFTLSAKVTHDGPVTTVTRSPFFSDLVLTVRSYFMIIYYFEIVRIYQYIMIMIIYM